MEIFDCYFCGRGFHDEPLFPFLNVTDSLFIVIILNMIINVKKCNLFYFLFLNENRLVAPVS